MQFQEAAELVGKAVDAAGVAVVVVGLAWASIVAATRLIQRRTEVYEQYRRLLGRSILLGLEFLVAGDIIRTVAIAPTFASVGVLAHHRDHPHVVSTGFCLGATTDRGIWSCTMVPPCVLIFTSTSHCPMSRSTTAA